jgi:hypothetical protein
LALRYVNDGTNYLIVPLDDRDHARDHDKR